MPILLKVNELEVGMSLASNVMNNYSMLLPMNHQISESDIMGLRRILPDVSVEVMDPILDKFVEFEDQTIERKVSLKVRKNISNMVSNVTDKVRSGVTLSSENVAGVRGVVTDMMLFMSENPATTALIEQSSDWDAYLREHSANVFYLSLMIGNTIKNYIFRERQRLSVAKKIHNAMDLTSLGMAAMLHDIGMVPIEHIYSKEESLTEEEKAKVLNHPIAGAESLPDNVDGMVKLVVRQHHENVDGSGYPEKLPGDKVSIFARILRVADAYSAAIANKVYGQKKTPVAILYEMLHGKYRKFYDPVILKVFSNIVQPFPIGAKMHLEDGTWAVVVKHNKKDPFNPEVIVAYDNFGDPIPKESLKEPFSIGIEGSLKIKTFDGENMSYLYDGNYDLQNQEVVVGELLNYSYP
ncbi:MAG: HD domain-containing protein [Phycisphaerae bacterium]|nr:HD domain-containing protein [Phycisphaerae bacterium]